MNNAEYARMDAQETSGWWFVGKRLFVAALMQEFGIWRRERPLLDVGCGAGAVLRSFEAAYEVAGDEVISRNGSVPLQNKSQGLYGLDPSPEALQFAHEKSGACLVCGSAERLPFASDSFQTVLLLDVLEHLDNDSGALREVVRVLRPGGHLVLSVPAFPLLWCDHDVALHHRRRYRRRGVEKLLNGVGFEQLYLGYIYSLVFPLAAPYRLWRRIHPPPIPRADIGVFPPGVNLVFTLLMRLESQAARKIRFPVGTSLLGLARKPSQALDNSL